MSAMSMRLGWRKIANLTAVLLLAAFFVVNLAGIFMTGPYAWDDGAITLAYAKTLAENGVFALTKASEVVEGTSSLLFTAVMALLHRIFQFDFGHFILASQLLAFSFSALTAWLVFRELREAISDPGRRLIVVCLFMVLPMFTAETLNGMEMSLMAFLMTAFYVSFNRRTRWIYLLIPLLILVRFEAIFYLGLSLLILLCIDKTQRPRIFLLGLYAFIIFMLITGWRWTYFGDFFPNTIWAKMNPPYSNTGGLFSRIASKMRGVVQFLQITTFILVPMLLSLLLREKHYRRNDLGVYLIASFALFAFISGKNWGYEGRMFLASLPIMMLVIGCSLSGFANSRQSLTMSWSKGSAVVEAQTVYFVGFLICLIGAHFSNGSLHADNMDVIFKGAHYRGLLPETIDAAVRRHLEDSPEEFADWYGQTPANYRLTGKAADEIRKILGRETINFMVPDVGGLSLCCENINVIDSGLLTNATLAKKGYGILDEYLAQVSPDLILTHGLWSSSSGIYDSKYFAENYRPIVFKNNFLWIRADHMHALLNSSQVIAVKIDKSTELEDVRYMGKPIDRKFINKEGISVHRIALR